MSKALAPVQNFYKTSLSAACTAGAGKLYIAIAPLYAVGYLVISPSNTTKREIVYYDSTGTDVNGIYVNIPTVAERGMGGTTAQVHDAQESVRANITGVHWEDMIAEVLTNIPADLAAITALLATKAGLAADNIFSGNNTFNGTSYFGNTVTFNNRVTNNVPVTGVDPISGTDLATMQYVLSIAFTAGLIAGFSSPQVNYNQNGRVQSVHDDTTGKTYVMIYDPGTEDTLRGVYDGTNTWIIAYHADGRIKEISKH